MFGDLLRRAIGTNPEAIQGQEMQQPQMGMMQGQQFMQQPMMQQHLDMFGQSNTFSNMLRGMRF